VTISRATGTLTFPANFMLAAAMNPCPCGYYGDPVKERTCSPSMIGRYRKRMPGTLVHRSTQPFTSFSRSPRLDGGRSAASLWDRHPHRSATPGIRETCVLQQLPFTLSPVYLVSTRQGVDGASGVKTRGTRQGIDGASRRKD